MPGHCLSLERKTPGEEPQKRLLVASLYVLLSHAGLSCSAEEPRTVSHAEIQGVGLFCS